MFLVCSSLYCTYQKWSKEGQLVNGRQGHVHTRLAVACLGQSHRIATIEVW